MNQVTLGMGKKAGDLPQIGGWVYIAAGARIVGDIKIGDNAVIGLNSVLMKDVPDCGIAMGVPARIHVDLSRPRNSDKATHVTRISAPPDPQ
jgi:serine O-acetyltransferase